MAGSKAISSDMYFGDEDGGRDRRAAFVARASRRRRAAPGGGGGGGSRGSNSANYQGSVDLVDTGKKVATRGTQLIVVVVVVVVIVGGARDQSTFDRAGVS